MQVIYDFWNKLWGNEEPKNAKGTVHQPVQGAAKPIPMTQKKSVNIASNPVACPKEPQLDIKTKRKAPENPIFQIQRQQINENSFNDIIDGEKYMVNYGEKTITITKADGSIKIINIEQLMKSSTHEEHKKIMKYLKEQNAGILADLASEAAYAHYFPKGYNKEGAYIPAFEELQINPSSLNHELMHALDNYNNDGENWQSFSDRLEYIKTAREEFAKFSASNERFVNGTTNHKLIVNTVDEIFAECGVLITSGGQLSYNANVIKKYFPKTLMLTRKYIDEARKLSQENRMNAKITTQNNQDGSIDYTRLTKENRPMSTIRFDKNAWPYIAAPYKAEYDENGILVKEVINEIFMGNIADQTVKTFDPKTKTQTIKTIDVNPYTDETTSITKETIKQDPFSRDINTRYYNDNKLTKETNKKISKDESEIEEEEIFYNSNEKPIKTIQKKHNLKNNSSSTKKKTKTK